MLGTFAAAAQTVTDGDTHKFNVTIYRLWGIDAPESKQSCADSWPTGKLATEYMTGLVATIRSHATLTGIAFSCTGFTTPLGSVVRNE